MRPREAAADDALDDQMVGGASCADAHAEIELPLRGQIEVDAREELLLLIAQRIESGERTVCSIVFQAAGNFLREVVADLCVGENVRPGSLLARETSGRAQD